MPKHPQASGHGFLIILPVSGPQKGSCFPLKREAQSNVLLAAVLQGLVHQRASLLDGSHHKSIPPAACGSPTPCRLSDFFPVRELLWPTPPASWPARQGQGIKYFLRSVIAAKVRRLCYLARETGEGPLTATAPEQGQMPLRKIFSSVTSKALSMQCAFTLFSNLILRPKPSQSKAQPSQN